MELRLWTVIALAFGRAFAAFVDGPSGANNATTPKTKDGNITIHYVDVGKTTNEFVPNSIRANVGDIVSFQFYPTNHSVIRSIYGYPCIPSEDVSSENQHPFFSGFHPVDSILKNPPTWNLTINDTNPIFYYCGAPGSCTDWGMVGVINANASTSIATQIRLAHQADYMLLPGQKFPSEAKMASLESLAATATTRTVTATTTPTHKTSSAIPSSVSKSGSGSEISSGAVAGVAIGAAAAAIGVAALFFLLRRTRALKKQLDEKPSPTTAEGSPWPGSGSRAATFVAASEQDQSRHTSQNAPPYRPYYHLMRPETKPAHSDTRPINGERSRSESPYTNSQGYRSYSSPDPNRYTFNSELHGDVPPVELEDREVGGQQGTRWL